MRDHVLCVFGSFGFMDIGDEAMLSEDLAYVTETLSIPRQQLYLVGGDPSYLSWYHSHPSERCLSDRRFRPSSPQGSSLGRLRASFAERRAVRQESSAEAAIAASNAVLVTGGGTINSRDSNAWSLKRVHRFVGECRRQNKPIFMSGQTIGPLGGTPQHDQLARDIIDAVDVLTTRDESYSQRYLDMIGAKPRRLIQTTDDAAALPYDDAPLPAEIEELTAARTAIAFNVTDYTANDQAKRAFMADVCEGLVGLTGGDLVMISHAPSDLGHLYAIRDMLADDVKRRTVVPDTRRWRDRQLKRLISRCRVAVGGRYHFVVFAATSDTPFVGLCGNHYSYVKQDGFARPLGLGDRILSERDTWRLDAVLQCARSSLDRPAHGLRDRLPRPSVSMTAFGDWLAAT